MRINMFSPFAPITSGVVTYSEDLAEALERHDVEINRVNRQFWSSYRLKLPGIYASGWANRFDWAFTKAVSPFYGLPQGSERTINHFHVSGGLFNWLVQKHYDRVKGYRVVTIHDQNFVTSNRHHPYDEAEQLKMLSESDLVIVHTEELKRRVGFANPNTVVIPHGVYRERFAIDPVEAKHRIGVEGPVVSQIGFMFNHKGIHDFIKATTRVEATILIVGSGPDEARLRRLADYLCPGRILFRPYVADSEFPYYLAASDIVVFPRIHSQGECSGVLVQAMAAGKAIVANNIGCFTEYLSHGRGILTEPENIHHLQSAILSLLQDSAACRQYGQACKDFAQRHLEWDLIADQHMTLYKQLAYNQS